MNKLPVIGWFFTAIGSIGLSVPFWLCWTVFEMGKIYFSFLPTLYLSIPFWHCFCLFLIIGILKQTFTPQFARVSNTNTCAGTK
jgi:hypothetical protein